MLIRMINKRKQEREKSPLGIDDKFFTFTTSNDYEKSFMQFHQELQRHNIRELSESKTLR